MSLREPVLTAIEAIRGAMRAGDVSQQSHSGEAAAASKAMQMQARELIESIAFFHLSTSSSKQTNAVSVAKHFHDADALCEPGRKVA